MTGLYFHIPYCRKACKYCDFHFSTALISMDDMVDCLISEMKQRVEWVGNQALDSIYFGGGTPSLLSTNHLGKILEEVEAIFALAGNTEITFESNPDDMTKESLDSWKSLGVNRLSVGIQSFHDNDLQWMGRIHDAKHSEEAIDKAVQAGFDTFSLDLIYGLPESSLAQWSYNVQRALALPVQHLSAYALTVEPKTALAYQIETNQTAAPDEEEAYKQYQYLQQTIAEDPSWEQYEVSNFCKDGHYAKHNTGYWQRMNYLGIGPAAHSFNGTNMRIENVPNNMQYMQGILSQSPRQNVEILTPQDQYNEYVMTGLRTKLGVDEQTIKNIGSDYLAHFKSASKAWIDQGKLLPTDNNHYRLTPEAYWQADGIARSLFQVS